ncbi:MAG: ABC transporter substrate-binding protein [Silicimonas sp.]|nr:ABC transporter substrate-binding protein [Silicimonas sp.]
MTRRETYISRQARRLSHGKIDRRRFVMSALASGVTLPTAMSLASRAEAARPRAGGHLRYGLAAESAAPLMAALTRNWLTRIDSTGAVTGDLAESLAPDAEGRRWQIALRPDLSADRVVQEIETRWPLALKTQLERIDTGPARLSLTLKRPESAFDRRLAQDDAGLELGHGLYRAAQDTPLHLTRNRDHWRQDAGHFDAITLQMSQTARARHNAVMTGEVDAIDQVDPRALAMMGSLPHLAHVTSAGPGHLALDVADPELRAALRHGLDRQVLLDRAVLGHGGVGDDSAARPDSARPGLSTFDPDRARAHLERSGYAGAPLGVAHDGTAEAERLMAALAASAAQAGLRFVTGGDERAPIRLHLSRDIKPGHQRLIPLWCDDLVVHAQTLAAPDGRRRPADVALHWWFA